MARDVTVTMTWTCDVCGDTATTPRGLPEGWRELRVSVFAMTAHMEDIHHVCGKKEPSCFGRLLVKLANEETLLHRD